MRTITNRLAFKIGIVIILAEIATLIVTGFYYTRKFSTEVDNRILAKAQLPGILINSGYLNLDAVSNEHVMYQLAGENLEIGMVVGINGNIFYSLDR